MCVAMFAGDCVRSCRVSGVAHPIYRPRTQRRYRLSVCAFLSYHIIFFAARFYAYAYAVMQCLCVRLSVCHVRTFCQTNKHYLQFFCLHTIVVFPYTKRHGNIPTGTLPPNGGVECRCSRHKSPFWTNSWLSIDDCCSANN